MGPRETGMWECDSDGGELPDRASGSCHTGLISPVTRQEARPVTCCAFQQVMKAGRTALGWQEPGAVRRKKRKDKMSCSPCRPGGTIFDFAAPRQLWIRSLHGADGWVCILHLEDEEPVCVLACVWHPWSQQQLILNVFSHKNALNDPWVFKLLRKTVASLFYPDRQ